MKKTFRVSRNYPKVLRNRKRRIERRLAPRNWEKQAEPMMSGHNIHYALSDRTHAHGYGGIGAVHMMVQRLGLVKEIDEHIKLLKAHLPYHESDHVLNIAYNMLAGAQRLEDIELRRQDESFLNGLGAQRIPDPTTAGDFTRRFLVEDITQLQECINRARQRVWQQQPEGFLAEAFIDVDRAVALVKPHAGTITLRGDTDFSHTAQLDRWDKQEMKFILGLDAHPKVVKLAEALAEGSWQRLERLPKYEILTEPRSRRERVKEQIVVEKGYRNLKLVAEDVTDLAYKPHQCEQEYRLVIVRKNISVQRGERALFEEIRYFFYLTNRWDLDVEAVVSLANGRCDQENVIEQLKNGVNAMRMPVDDLVSNWAYMVMTTLAWNLKAWFGLLVPDRERGLELLGMEFRRFLHAVMLLPVQISRTGRKIIYRVLSYNGWVKELFATFQRIVALGSG